MVYNFGAGPTMLPQEVLKEVYQEFFNFRNSGMSVMEINHRSPLFNDLLSETKSDLRDLLKIPDNYKILFLQGGASLQFAAIPMNLMKKGKAGFIITGHWAKRAYEEAKMYGDVVVLASSENKNYSYIPDCSGLKVSNDYDYVHICENNTIYGTQFKVLPNVGKINLVSDVSSCILSEPINVSKYALLFAGTQKNMGIAGATIVIIREDLVHDSARDDTPFVMRYSKQIEEDSRFNTPPCYSIYICGKMFKWIKKLGGLSAIKEMNLEKARLLYDFIDNSKLFCGTAQRESRSLMNVTFTTGDNAKDMEIVEDSKRHGFVSVKGHRFVGGLRASLYNAVPVENVRALINYLKTIEMTN